MKNICSPYYTSPTDLRLLETRQFPSSIDRHENEHNIRKLMSHSLSKQSFLSNETKQDTYHSKSTSYINAMKALQDKIRVQEEQTSSNLREQQDINQQLSNQLQALEQRYQKLQHLHGLLNQQSENNIAANQKQILGYQQKIRTLELALETQQQELEDRCAFEAIDTRHRSVTFAQQIDRLTSENQEQEVLLSQKEETIEDLQQQLNVERSDNLNLRMQNKMLFQENAEICQLNRQLDEGCQSLQHQNELLTRVDSARLLQIKQMESMLPLRIKQLEFMNRELQKQHSLKINFVNQQYAQLAENTQAALAQKEEQIQQLIEKSQRRFEESQTEKNKLMVSPAQNEGPPEQSKVNRDEQPIPAQPIPQQSIPEQTIPEHNKLLFIKQQSEDMGPPSTDHTKDATPSCQQTPQKPNLRPKTVSPPSKRYLLMRDNPAYEQQLKAIISIELQVKDLDAQYEMVLREAEKEGNMKRKTELRQQLMGLLTRIKHLNDEKSSLLIAQNTLEKDQSFQ